MICCHAAAAIIVAISWYCFAERDCGTVSWCPGWLSGQRKERHTFPSSYKKSSSETTRVSGSTRTGRRNPYTAIYRRADMLNVSKEMTENRGDRHTETTDRHTHRQETDTQRQRTDTHTDKRQTHTDEGQTHRQADGHMTRTSAQLFWVCGLLPLQYALILLLLCISLIEKKIIT